MSAPSSQLHKSVSLISGVRIPSKSPTTLWDISISSDTIASISPHDHAAPHDPRTTLSATSQFLAPSLCHPHIHLDKPFLLSSPTYSDLTVHEGTFAEALDVTERAKARFTVEDLVTRGRRLIQESVAAGVTAMRAFVEVDGGVGMTCIEAGEMLKREFNGICDVQLCAFAQLAVFSGEDDGEKVRRLMEEAVSREAVEVIGSTPYVESDLERMKKNVEWAIDLSLRTGKHLDFHLDYNLDPDPEQEPLVWFVLSSLKAKDYAVRRREGQSVTFGHCTRLTLFTPAEWHRLQSEIAGLPISFVGLPTSDLYMMGRPTASDDGGGQRVRGTLQIPQMVQEYGLWCAIGVNNVGNAFTPQGSCDPMALASLGMGVYQAGSERDCEVLYECVSTRAKEVIGVEDDTSLGLRVGRRADFVLFGRKVEDGEEEDWKTRRSISEIVRDAGSARTTVKGGQIVSQN
ncbi:MAG: hypothetical protein M1833_002734 [Piccolia ochrophora]|nr:MAG: hypothetical protein M1833_002734 [Piccolia ochrophora]